jgi:hypothetical protein
MVVMMKSEQSAITTGRQLLQMATRNPLHPATFNNAITKSTALVTLRCFSHGMTISILAVYSDRLVTACRFLKLKWIYNAADFQTI